MDPDEAVQAHLDLGAAESIAMHFGVFQLTAERSMSRPPGWPGHSLHVGYQPETFALWK
jgi:L-ascorbate metabolism protein UlaG (beta-lactamase superfamily)